MKKSFIAVLLAAVVICTVFALPLTAREDAATGICVLDFDFLDDSGSAINTPAEKIKASISFENLKENSVSYAFSLAAYSDGELLDMKTEYGAVKKEDGVVNISTSEINVDPSLCDEVHAFLTTDDFTSLLSPMAVMGSSVNEITEIFVGDEKIELTEGKNEYELKMYLTADKFPVKIRAGRKELGQKILIDELTENEQTVKISSSSNNGENNLEYTLNLKLYEVKNTSLTGLKAGGTEISGFNPMNKEYIVKTGIGDTEVPQITAEAFSKEASVEITQATELPGNATVAVTSEGETETYTVKFTKAVQATFDSWASHRGKGQIEPIYDDSGEPYITLCSYAAIDSNKVSGDSRINYYAFTLPGNQGKAVSAELNMKFRFNPGGNYVYYQYNADDMATHNVRSYPVWKGFDNHDESLRLGEYHDAAGGYGTISLDGTKMKFAPMEDGNVRTIILAEKLYEGAAIITYLYNPSLVVHFVKEGV